MKLYTSIGPNPKTVTAFLAEKGVKLETVRVDIAKAENRARDYLNINPTGQTPALQLDDGQRDHRDHRHLRISGRAAPDAVAVRHHP